MPAPEFTRGTGPVKTTATPDIPEEKQMTPFHRALARTLASLFVCVTSDGATEPPTGGGANMAKKLFRDPKSEA